MVNNLEEIQKYLKNKNICVLGNSGSILDNKKDIENFDVVCRMNRGVSTGKEAFIGKRTDILFLSTKLTHSMFNIFNPKYTVWMTESEKRVPNEIKKIAIQNPVSDWYELKKQLVKNPSTGCLAIYFLLKYIDFNTLTIYGFDGYKTGTWYHNLKRQNWHYFDREILLIGKWIKNKENVRLI